MQPAGCDKPLASFPIREASSAPVAAETEEVGIGIQRVDLQNELDGSLDGIGQAHALAHRVTTRLGFLVSAIDVGGVLL
jgi:hypothetical protein